MLTIHKNKVLDVIVNYIKNVFGSNLIQILRMKNKCAFNLFWEIQGGHWWIPKKTSCLLVFSTFTLIDLKQPYGLKSQNFWSAYFFQASASNYWSQSVSIGAFLERDVSNTVQVAFKWDKYTYTTIILYQTPPCLILKGNKSKTKP